MAIRAPDGANISSGPYIFPSDFPGMGPFWKWIVGFMAWGQLGFIETNTLSSVGHQPIFYEYKVKGDNIQGGFF